MIYLRMSMSGRSAEPSREVLLQVVEGKIHRASEISKAQFINNRASFYCHKTLKIVNNMIHIQS